MVELAGEANWLAANTPLDNTHVMGSTEYTEQATLADQWKAKDAAHSTAVMKWTIYTLMPELEGTSVIKVTRSTKKAKGAILKIPNALLLSLGFEYKTLLGTSINPKQLLPKLVAGESWLAVRECFPQADGEPMSNLALFNLLWSKKEQNQWAHSLLEYANALVGLVAYAQSLDPHLAPRKYLCYFQKKSEATLYRGQDELDAMVATMRADNMLSAPLYTNEPKPEWETQYHNPRLEDSKQAEGNVTANPSAPTASNPSTQRELSKTRRHVEAASSGKQGFIEGAGDKEADAKGVTTSAPLTLSQKLAAKRAAKQQQL